MMIKRSAIWISLVFVMTGLSIFPQNGYAQNTPDKLRESYLTPPDKISKQVLAPRYKNVFLSNLGPRKKYFVNYLKDGNFTSISQYAKFFYNLGGLEIDPAANRKRTLTNQYKEKSGSGLLLTNVKTGETRVIETPKEAHVSNLKWSPDGKKIAFFAHFKNGTYIYVADVKNGRSKRLTKQPVLATLNTDFDWSANASAIFTVLVPKDRGAEPQKQEVALPQVRMTSTKKNRLRTYLYLLENPYQAKLLKYYTTGQYAKVDVAKGRVHEIGKPAIIKDFQAAPNGKYSIVKVLDTPFTYILPVSRFGWKQAIWDNDGKVLATLQTREDRLGIPYHSTYKYKRRKRISWRPDGKGLSMIDRHKNKKTKKWKYQVIQWTAPFYKRDKKVLYESKYRVYSVFYAENPEWIFVTKRKSGKRQLFAVDLNQSDSAYAIYNYKKDNIYKAPGHLLFKKAKTGLSVVLMTPDNKSVYLSGVQYSKHPSKKAPRPFLDQINIVSGKKDRIFKSAKNSYEKVISVLDNQANHLVISKETATEFPNFWNLDLSSGQKKQLTENVDYNKDITDAVRKRFKVERPDGFKFWVTVVLPKNWNGKPLPGLIWHYPLEYKNQKAYNKKKRKYNKNEFPQITHGWPERSEQILIQEGYAIIKADWPIYSARGESNDAFVYSVQQNSTVVVDSVVSKGYVKRNQIAIGGHSYGGFGTINALTHTSLFKAGIAGDANSNRLLTPLGFQHEKRDLWRGRSTYLQVSPILWANRLDGALLMYSGADDQNVGTAPFMSWQLFHALNALGKTSALYMYPYAQHHTNAKEIVLDRWTRWIDWLNHYVKENGKNVSENDL